MEDGIERIRLTPVDIGSSMEIQKLRKSSELLYHSFKKRRLDQSILDEFFEIDKGWRELKSEIDRLREERNRISLEVKKKKDENVIRKARENNQEIKTKEEKLDQVSQARDKMIYGFPNLLDPSVPTGEDPKILGYVGTPKVSKENLEAFKKINPGVPHLLFKNIKSQYDIIKEYGLVDEERGSELSGARFYYKKNELVLLGLALSLYATKRLVSQGFIPMVPPYLVKRYVEERATTADAFEEALYKIEDEELYLIPSSEHPLAAYNHNRIFNEPELPIRYAGFSACFRKEAGAHGKDTKGIYRNHHFDKVEQFVLCTPKQSEEEINRLMDNQVQLLVDLNIPVRVSLLPSWDMDKKASIQADVEGWFPARNDYGELGSQGYLGTWQSARFNIKYIPAGQTEPIYLNTIYGTMVAVERALACMLENNIEEDGIISIPKALQEYSGIKEINPINKQV